VIIGHLLTPPLRPQEYVNLHFMTALPEAYFILKGIGIFQEVKNVQFLNHLITFNVDSIFILKLLPI
jgi:hypothetical protein